jgi:nucleoside-diphosphate-sugar epimerase
LEVKAARQRKLADADGPRFDVVIDEAVIRRLHGIADPEIVEHAAQGVTTVYHLAAVYREAKHPDFRYREVNVDASRRLLDASVAASVRRYVHCSTVGVHGHIASPRPTSTPPTVRRTSTRPASARRSSSLSPTATASRSRWPGLRPSMAPVIPVCSRCSAWWPGAGSR